MDKGVHGIGDIDYSDEYELSDKQKNQVLAHKLQEPIINIEKIAEELASLKFPLYFFDYETFPPAIPLFDGYGPYQHIPFQFSLHILREPQGELEHIEYLLTNFQDPSSPVVAELLKKHIIGGTVIAWYKSFETRMNKEIGIEFARHATFFRV